MRKAVLHHSGEVTLLKNVTLGQISTFLTMYPRVHIFVVDEKELAAENLVEDVELDEHFGDDPVWGGY